MISKEVISVIYGTVTQPRVGGVTESGGDAGEQTKLSDVLGILSLVLFLDLVPILP